MVLIPDFDLKEFLNRMDGDEQALLSCDVDKESISSAIMLLAQTMQTQNRILSEIFLKMD